MKRVVGLMVEVPVKEGHLHFGTERSSCSDVLMGDMEYEETGSRKQWKLYSNFRHILVAGKKSSLIEEGDSRHHLHLFFSGMSEGTDQSSGPVGSLAGTQPHLLQVRSDLASGKMLSARAQQRNTA